MNPDDVAAAAERARRTVDVATWTAIGLGLAFTAVNVQAFAAAGAPWGSPGWSVAWLLDPMVSILLLAVVRAEQVTARWQVPMPWQVSAVKWAAFAATYAMNTWSAWRDGIPSSVVLHSVPPVFVLLAAEVAPALRDRLTQAVRVAATSSAADMETLSSAASASEKAAHIDSEQGPGPVGELPTCVDEPTSALDTTSTDGDDTDPRVREIAGLLAAGCDVTGAQAAALHHVSDRTGRRLLADARTHLEQHPTTERPDLHLVALRTAGGTAS